MRSTSLVLVASFALGAAGCSEPLPTADAMQPLFFSPNYVAIVVDGFAARPENTALTAGFATVTPAAKLALAQSGRCFAVDMTPPPGQSRQARFAGDITIAFGNQSRVLRGDGADYQDDAVPAPAPGTAFAVSLPNPATGMGTFAGTVHAMPTVALQPGAWHDAPTIAASDDLAIEWTPVASAAGGMVAIDLQSGEQLVQCQIPLDEGRVVVPRQLLGKLAPGGVHLFFFVVDRALVTSSGGENVELTYSISPTFAGANYPRHTLQLTP